MSDQLNAFVVDHAVRKAAKLGLSHDLEVVVDILEESKRLYRSLANYQIGVVDCEMKRLSASDRSTELTRLWADTFTSFTNLGNLLGKYGPIDQAIEGEIRSEIAAEKAKTAGESKLDSIDKEFRDTPGSDPQESDE